MELKVKTSQWSTGNLVVLLNVKTAEKMGLHSGDRILIKTKSEKPKKISAIVDTTERKIKEGEISVSQEIKKRISLREGQKVLGEFLLPPKSSEYIKRKLIGGELTHSEIKEIIKDIVENNLSEPEVSVFVSAMYKNGMTFKETISLIDAILYSGKTLHFRKKLVVDKHCIGGIAGNRTTPLVVSICAAAGLTFPKTSSRAITSAAGTADTVEVLSPVGFSMEQLKKIVKKTNACLAWGGSIGMVPADSKIIKIEKMLKLDPPAQLLASIMSKKLASGSKYILIDIPYGKDAKVTKSKGKILKKKFKQLAKHFGVEMKVVLTRATEPIGNGIGPALEIKDCMNILNQLEKGPKDLEEKALFLAGEIFEMTNVSKKGEGKRKAEDMLYSGLAWKKFKEIIAAQGGKIKEIHESRIKRDILATKNGKVKRIDNHLINYLARVLGCPKDKYAGVYIHHHVGEKIKKGEPIITIYAESKSRLNEGLAFLEENKHIFKI